MHYFTGKFLHIKLITGFKIINRAVEQLNLVCFTHFKFACIFIGYKLLAKRQVFICVMIIVANGLHLQKIVYPVLSFLLLIGMVDYTYPVAIFPMFFKYQAGFIRLCSINSFLGYNFKAIAMLEYF